jgi:hypothetical protein
LYKAEKVPESGGTMLERAVNLKKRNLEPTKGNRFLSLQVDDLSQMAKDVTSTEGRAVRSGEKGMVLKLDYEKAYDRVS